MMDPIDAGVRQAALVLALCNEQEEEVFRKAGTREQVYEAHLATVRARGALDGALMLREVRRSYHNSTYQVPGN